jgi:HEAT repeat protein
MSLLRSRRLVHDLSARDDGTRWAAAVELAQTRDERTLRRVERVLENGSNDEGRAAAAYVLGFSGATESADALARRLVDADESAVVRAYAAEALGHMLAHQPVLAEIRTAIVSTLNDPEPEVRFWSAFAAGALDLQESRQRLERLLRDESFVEGWWTVGQEAEWALRCLDGEEHPPLPDRV